MKPHIIWPLFVGGIALTCLCGAAALIYAAHSDPTFAVEPDYYKRAVQWDETARQRRLDAALGWGIAIESQDRGGVIATLHDKSGSVIERATLVATAFANARASERQEVSFTPMGDGRYRAELTPGIAGSWRFQFVAQNGGDIFTADLDYPLTLD